MAIHDYLRYSGLGVQFAATLGLPVALGLWLDRKFDSSPWLILAGTALGGSAAFYHLVKVVFPGRSPSGKGSGRKGLGRELPGDDLSRPIEKRPDRRNGENDQKG